MIDERDFIHDVINKLTMTDGILKRTIKKASKFSKEEILEMNSKALSELESAFKIIKARKIKLDKK